MTPQPLFIAAILVLYLAVVTGTGVYVSRRYQDKQGSFISQYFLGGRGLGGYVLAMTLVATYTSASSFLGGPGTAYQQGLGWVLLAMIQLPSMYVTLGVLGKRFAIVGRKIKAVTVVDFLRERYEGNRAVTVLSAFFIVAFLMAAVVAQFIGGARLFQSVTGLSYIGSLLLFTTVVMVYVTLGGFAAVALNDAINGTVMFVGTVILLFTTVSAGGGVANIVEQLHTINPDLLTPTGVDHFISLPWISSFWVLVCIGILGLPQNAVRAMAYKDSRAMHNAIIIGTVVIGMLMLGMHLTGVFARVILPGIKVTDMAIPLLAVELLPPILAALVLAGPMAAIMSTVDSQLIYIAGTIIKDVYLNYVNPQAEDHTVSQLSRACNVILSVVIFTLAIRPPSVIVWINLFAFGGLQAAFFWPLLLGLYWKRANATGALVSQVAGVAAFMIFTVYLPRPLGLHPIVPTLLISLIAFLVATYATEPPRSETIEKFWGYRQEETGAKLAG